METVVAPLLGRESPPLPVPPESLPAGWRGWCGGRIVKVGQVGLSLAAIAGSIAWGVKCPSRVSTALGSLGAGLGFQTLVNSCIPNRYASRVEQVSQTVFGQSTLFLGSQLAGNGWISEGAAVAGIGGMLGVNLALWGKRLADNRFGLQVPQPESDGSRGAQFECLSSRISRKKYAYLKGIAAVAGFSSWALSSVSVVQGLGLWCLGYFSMEPLAQHAADRIAKWVEKKSVSVSAPSGFSNLKRSAGLVTQTCANTFSYLAIPLSMIPWDRPGSLMHTSHRFVSGVLTGLFAGFLYGTQENELTEPHIDQVAALKPRVPPVQNAAFKAWKAAWPVFIFGSVTAFAISQWASASLTTQDKLGMGAMYLGYLYASAKSFAISRWWNAAERNRKMEPTLGDVLVDGRVVSQFIPRIAGVNPIHAFYAIASVIRLQSGQTLDAAQQALFYPAWFFYGKGMGTEFNQTFGEARGMVSSLPTMLFMDAILTLFRHMMKEG